MTTSGRKTAPPKRSIARRSGRRPWPIETNVANGTYHWGSAKEVTEQLIEVAEHAGANSLLVNMDLGAVPHELYLEQIRRFGREVLPRLQAHQVTRVPPAAASR